MENIPETKMEMLEKVDSQCTRKLFYGILSYLTENTYIKYNKKRFLNLKRESDPLILTIIIIRIKFIDN